MSKMHLSDEHNGFDEFGFDPADRVDTSRILNQPQRPDLQVQQQQQQQQQGSAQTPKQQGSTLQL